MWMWGDWGGNWGWWGWVLMPLMMVLVWAPILFLLAWGARVIFGAGERVAGPPAPPAAPEPDARELARRAYARGELTRERFVQIIEDLDRTESARR